MKKNPYDPAVRDRIHRQMEADLIRNIPRETLHTMAKSLFTIVNLAWGYAWSLCDVAAQMRIPELKQAVRTVRRLKREHDSLHNFHYAGSTFLRYEEQNAERLEAGCGAALRRMRRSLAAETKRLGMSDDYGTLLFGTYEAVVMIRACFILAERYDNMMRGFGVNVGGRSLLPLRFKELRWIIPAFGGDCFNPGLKIIELTARRIADKAEKNAAPDFDSGRQVS